MPEAVPAPDVDGTEPQIVIDLSHEEAGETSEEGALRSVAPKNRSKKRASDVLEDGATSNGEAAPLISWGANRPVRGTRKEVSYNVTKYYEGLVVDEPVAGSEAGKGGARSSKKRRSSSLVDRKSVV